MGEFLAAMAGQRYSGLGVALLGTKSACYEAFKALDQDDSDELTVDEVQYLLEHASKCTVTLEEAQSVLDEADTDGDGKISFKEFHAMMMGEVEMEVESDDSAGQNLPHDASPGK